MGKAVLRALALAVMGAAAFGFAGTAQETPPPPRPADLAAGAVAATAPAMPSAAPAVQDMVVTVDPALPDAAMPGRGPVTNLPLPRYVSLKGVEGNARRGPGLNHRIDWVFTRREMPLEVTAEFENWRRVQDRDGAGGWVHYSLLSGNRTVLTLAETALTATPDPQGQVNAVVEAGVVARVSECAALWCRVSAGGQRGWIPKGALWGVGADEVLD